MKNYEVLNSVYAFNNVINNGKKIICRSCIIFVLKDSSYNLPRFGWIVSSKNGNAVIRNKIKRRFRVISSLVLKELNVDSSVAICYIAKKQAFLLDFKVIQNEVISNIKKYI
jgi:ribonuclease P protein component